MDKREHWSHSQLKTLLDCPLLYKFKYLEKREPEFTPDYFPFGNAVHEAHKALCNAFREGRELSETDAQKTFGEAWEVLGADPMLRFGKNDWGDLLNLGLEMVKVLHREMPREKVVAIDAEFNVPLITGGGEILERPLNGIFDLIVQGQDGLTVVDFKTASKKYSPADVAADMQATAYLLAAPHVFDGAGKVSFRFDVITKAKKPAFVSYPTSRTDQDISRLVSLFQQAEREIAAGVFLPRRSWRCKSCSYETACAAWAPQEREAAVLANTR